MQNQRQTSNNTKKLKVLITRPKAKNKKLALLLKQHGIDTWSQSLFDYQANADEAKIVGKLSNANIVIFVSVAAVEFFHAATSLNKLHNKKIIAVGKATKKALKILNINNILSPEQENSEGVLLLPILSNNLTGKIITIVRGNGGREHLATQLKSRGAIIQYIESYQRIWKTLPKDIAKQWQAMQINCIVITSNEILEKVVHCLRITDTNTISEGKGDGNNNEKSDNYYWVNTCHWLVISKRIADNANKFGLKNVFNSDSANDLIILNHLKKIQNKH